MENPTCGAELRNKLSPLCNALAIWKCYLKDPNSLAYKQALSLAMKNLDLNFEDFIDLSKYLDRYEFNREDFEKIINE